MRDDDAEAGEIVIVNLLGLLNVEFAIAIEQAQQLPLFRVDAEHRIEGIEVLGFGSITSIEPRPRSPGCRMVGHTSDSRALTSYRLRLLTAALR